MPIKYWFRGSMQDYAREMLLSVESRSFRLLSRAEIVGTIDGHGRGMRDLSRRIWLFLMFEHWCRSYRV